MRWRSIAIGAGVLLASIVLVLWLRPSPRIATVERAAPGATSSPAPSDRPVAAPAPQPDPVQLTVTLLAADGAVPDPGSIEVGLARIDPADLEQLASDEANVETGPDSIAALGNVERWIRVPATPLGNGDVQVGPFDYDGADRVRLVAAGGGLAYYALDFDPDDPPATVAPRFASGVRVLADAERFAITWHPAGSWPDPVLWQSVIERVAPDVLAASRDRPLGVAREGVLAPLPPGAAIELAGLVDGIEAERRPVELIAGRIVDVRFDAARIAAARAQAVELAVEVVERGSGRPLALVDVLLQRPDREERQRTDVTGRVTFRALDRRAAHALTIVAPPSSDPLPAFPAQHVIDVAIGANEGLPPQQRVERRVELAALRYVVLELAKETTTRIAQLAETPYPIYALERADGAVWRDTASEHFVVLDDGIAVSVGEPGRYRVLVATSPWHVLRSAEAVVADGSPQRTAVALLSSVAAPRSVRIVQDDVPVANARWTIRGPHRSLPPLVRAADTDGRVALGPANVERIAIDLPQFQDEVEVDLDRNADVEIGGRETRGE